MTRILFVDDEPAILDGLRRALWLGGPADWKAEFCAGGPAAAARLRQAEYDVLVTDMRMPELSGAELLELAHELHPAMVCIVLSGHAELEAAARAIPVAHQFLAKPCDVEHLQQVVSRALQLRETIESRDLRRVTAGLRTLPSRPGVYQRLKELIAEPEFELAQVAEIVAGDIGLTARVLQIANSPYFGARHRVADVRRAVSHLGIDAISSLVLAEEVQRTFANVGELACSVHEHSLRCAALASSLCETKEEKETAFSAGILHHIGQLIFANTYPLAYRTTLKQSATSGTALHELEMKRWGASHADLGAYLLCCWGLPYPIVEAVAYHHTPHKQNTSARLAAIVHIASTLTSGENNTEMPLDMDYLSNFELGGTTERRLQEYMLAM